MLTELQKKLYLRAQVGWEEAMRQTKLGLMAVIVALPFAADGAGTPFPEDRTGTLCARDEPSDFNGCWLREGGFLGALGREWSTIPEEFRAACVAEQADDFGLIIPSSRNALPRNTSPTRTDPGCSR